MTTNEETPFQPENEKEQKIVNRRSQADEEGWIETKIELAQEQLAAHHLEAQLWIEERLQNGNNAAQLINKIDDEIADLESQESKADRSDTRLTDRLEVARAKRIYALEEQDKAKVLDIARAHATDTHAPSGMEKLNARRQQEVTQLADKALENLKGQIKGNEFRLRVARKKLEDAQKREAWRVTQWMLEREVKKFSDEQKRLETLIAIGESRSNHHKEIDESTGSQAAK